MQATIKLSNFDINTDQQATVIAEAGPEKFTIEFFFAEGPDWNRHKIDIAGGAALDLPHYTQAMIVLEASKMIDSHFDEEGEPYNEKMFDA